MQNAFAIALERDQVFARKAELLARLESLPAEEDDVSSIPDDRLALVFTCCHPRSPPRQSSCSQSRIVPAGTPSGSRREFACSNGRCRSATPAQPAPGRDRGVPRRGSPARGDGLGADRRALQGADAKRCLTERRVEPHRRRRNGRGSRAGLGADRRDRAPGYHLPPATRADLFRRLDRREEAASAYAEALALEMNTADRAFLERRLAEVVVSAA